MRITMFGPDGLHMTTTDVVAVLVTEIVDGEECVQLALKQEGDILTWHGADEPDDLRCLAESVSGIKFNEEGKKDASTDTEKERKEE